jgi:serine/threonine-protein kinase RsbW
LSRRVLRLPRVPASVGRVRAVLDRCLTAVPVTEQCRGELALLLTEASTNAVVHGSGDAPFEVSIAVAAEECVLEVSNRDGDIADLNLQAPLPPPGRFGGRGLPVIVALADAVRVSAPRPGWVRLHMVKRLETRTG